MHIPAVAYTRPTASYFHMCSTLPADGDETKRSVMSSVSGRVKLSTHAHQCQHRPIIITIYIIVFYYFIIVSCFHLSLASWLLFSNKVQFSSVQHIVQKPVFTPNLTSSFKLQGV